MTFGSDYAIWEPKWQIEGFLNWEMPDEPQFSDYPRLDQNGKRKILGLNAAQLYDLEVPSEVPQPTTVAAGAEDNYPEDPLR
jgi:predicted TIM-barrel fold metal-dependent hydrolase